MITGWGHTDEEYRWEPVPEVRTVRAAADGGYRSDGPAERGDARVFTTLPWRLCHIVDLLQEERNATWLGLSAPSGRVRPTPFHDHETSSVR